MRQCRTTDEKVEVGSTFQPYLDTDEGVAMVNPALWAPPFGKDGLSPMVGELPTERPLVAMLSRVEVGRR